MGQLDVKAVIERGYKKAFFSFEDVTTNFNNYLDELEQNEHFIEVYILLHQDFKEKIEKVINNKFENDAHLTKFIYSLELSKILSKEELEVYKRFNIIRNLLAHEVLEKQKNNKDYTQSAKLDWKNGIKNFKSSRYLIYKKLLEHVFSKIDEDGIKANVHNYGNVAGEVMWESHGFDECMNKVIGNKEKIKELQKEFRALGDEYLKKLVESSVLPE